MSSMQSFNPFGASRDSLRNAVFGDLETPLGASRNLSRSNVGIGGGGTPLSRGLPPGGSFSAGGQGLSATSAGSRYKPPAYVAPGGTRYQGFGPGSTGGGAGRGGFGQQGGLISQGAGFLGEETNLLQQAADRQFVRNNEPIGNMRDLLGRSGEITQVGNETAQGLTDLSNRQSTAFEAGVNEAMGNFDQTYASDVQAAISGIRESYQPQMQAIRNGMNPDGTLMTPAQQKDAMFAMNSQVGSQVQNTFTQLASSYNQARASLAQGFSGQRLNSQQLAGSLQQTAASIRNAAQATALQFEASGNQAMADLIYRNPESIVSRFQGLLALAGLASAPGAQNLPAIQGI